MASVELHAARRLAAMPGNFVYPERLAALDPERSRASIAGSETSWWTYEPREAHRWAGDTVIAIHGFRGDHHGLELFAAFWPEQRFIVPDLPGFGESEPLPDDRQSIDSFANWLSAFVDAVRPARGRVVLLGHSFGSIVVSAALARGLDVDAAVLINPISAPALEGPRGVLTAGAIAWYRLGAALPERLGRAWLSNRTIVRFMGSAMAKNPEPKMRRFVHEQHHAYFSRFANRQALLATFQTSVSHNVADYAASIAVPLLLIAAENDDITPVSAQHVVAESAPQATLRIIPNVGHLIHYETPAVAVEHMREFLTTR